ncbi:MAG: hypothetical protein D3924_02700 [Candidatus Electrothrix sp. AR4]|nr:hypothetical protein [Candidatus Electrothrix sp. AR4]
MKSSCCQLCGTKEETISTAGYQACSACRSVVDTFRKHPAIIKKLCSEMQNASLFCDVAEINVGKNPELPEVLDGKRYRAIDRDQNKWYLSVSEVDGQPVEVFASTAFDRDHELQSRISNLTTITRLISLILRHIFLNEVLTLKKCLKQIKRSSRNKNDLPDMLYRVLSRYPEAS